MARMYSHLAFLLGALLSASWSWLNTLAFSSSLPNNPFIRSSVVEPSRTSSLYDGVGVADTYSWNEEQFELEVKLTVPAGTSAKDVKFKCSSESIDLRLLNGASNDDDDDSNSKGERLLLDGSRRTRGKICADGTFWSIEGNPDKEREITITIEKLFLPASSGSGTETFDAVTDFDWGGLYPNDEEEVSHRKYDEAEELNVREYAAKLGVDIDNIDMSKVNKTMFGSGLGDEAESSLDGLDDVAEGGNGDDGNTVQNKNDGFRFNITQATLDQLTKSGLAKEVLQQGDGTEYELGSDGSLDEERKFSMLGKEVSEDELREAGIMGGNGGSNVGVPAMFAERSLPVEEAPGYQKTYDAGNSLGDGIIESEIVESEITSDNDDIDIISGTAEKLDCAVEVDEQHEESTADSALEADLYNEKSEEIADKVSSNDDEPMDPIDMLTVVKLKDILRAQGLKVSGTKQILRDRLRNHVNTLLQEE
mmetsp:Transcript_7891/g.14274  ORF Transcript_7891/g.14274 Transcript_7891/m.14274 type:complete len:479 (-) Transcript_7891:59-1495(-)